MRAINKWNTILVLFECNLFPQTIYLTSALIPIGMALLFVMQDYMYPSHAECIIWSNFVNHRYTPI